MSSDSERADRAATFAANLKATNLSITEFQRRSGLTRNVIYNLSKGQKPSSAEQAAALAAAFDQLKSK